MEQSSAPLPPISKKLSLNQDVLLKLHTSKGGFQAVCLNQLPKLCLLYQKGYSCINSFSLLQQKLPCRLANGHASQDVSFPFLRLPQP